MRREDKTAKDRYLAKIQMARSAGETNPFETEAEKAKRIKRLKTDYDFFIRYYFSHYAKSDTADFQIQFAKQVARNKTYKGFCQWGRGLAKSVHNDIFIPFWLWLRGEPIYFVVVGSSKDKAVQLLEDLQAEFQANPRIISDFGEQITHGSWSDSLWVTKGGFIGQALGMGQSVRGLRVKEKRPTHIVVDDVETREISKNEKRQEEYATWMEKDLIPTMDGDIRRFIKANNKYEPMMIQTKLQERHPKWKIHEVNAYDPITYKPIWTAKYSDTYYKELEEEIGSLSALAEYNNQPHSEGKIFKDEMIQWAKVPRINHYNMLVCHWDIAYAGTATADYNAMKIWGLKGRNFFALNCFVKQSKMKAALLWLSDVLKSLPEGVILHNRFESQFWNDAVKQTIEEVEKEQMIEFRFVKVDTPKGKKYDRIITLHPYYQNGRIFYNEKMRAHKYTQVGINQLKGIEPGYSSHDDSPDADEQAIKFLSKHIHTRGSGKILVGKADQPDKW